MVKSPRDVDTLAVYVLAGSMHMGGGFSNTEVRSAEPPAGGHGVSPVTFLPSGTTGTLTLVSPGAVVPGADVSVLAVSVCPRRWANARPPATAMTTKAMMP